MIYCKDCEYLRGTKCFRPVDDPVRGENASLELDALYQRTEYSGGRKGPYYEYQYHDFCGMDAKYFKLDTKSFDKEAFYGSQEI